MILQVIGYIFFVTLWLAIVRLFYRVIIDLNKRKHD